MAAYSAGLGWVGLGWAELGGAKSSFLSIGYMSWLMCYCIMFFAMSSPDVCDGIGRIES